MPAPHQPPPGAMPSPDVASMMQQAMSQKSQQSGSSSMGQAPAGAGTQSGQPTTFQHQHEPRAVGSFSDEAERAIMDIYHQFKDLLGLRRPPKSPEEKAQLQQFHHKYQSLDAEQQQAFQLRMQQEQQRKEIIRQEEEAKAAQKAQAEAQSQELNMPGGKVSGQAAMDKMQRDRKGLGGGD